MFPTKEKVKIGETKVLLLIYKFVAFWFCTQFEMIHWLLLLKPFSLIIQEIDISVTSLKNQFNLHNWEIFSFRILAILRNKRKLAAVSRETPENTRKSQSENTLDPGMAEEFIAHVSEKIEGGSLSSFPKNLAGQSYAVCLLCLNLMNFFWTHKFGLVP